MNVTTATPVEIDTALATAYGEINAQDTARTRALDTLSKIEAVQGTYEADYPWFSAEKREEAAAVVRLADAKIRRLHAEVEILVAEYNRRGGWTRFYLVTNAGGHVHFTRDCDSCFDTTSFNWLVDYSGMTHEALVDLAGSQACTVCFPDAPVETRTRASRIETAERRARRIEKEAKDAAKAAAEIRVEGFHGFGADRNGVKVFKTQRALTNEIASNLTSLCIYGVDHPSAAAWALDIAAMRNALDAKSNDHGYDYDKALAAARKKVTRDCGTAKF